MKQLFRVAFIGGWAFFGLSLTTAGAQEITGNPYLPKLSYAEILLLNDLKTARPLTLTVTTETWQSLSDRMKVSSDFLKMVNWGTLDTERELQQGGTVTFYRDMLADYADEKSILLELANKPREGRDS